MSKLKIVYVCIFVGLLLGCVSRPPSVPVNISISESIRYNDKDELEGSISCNLHIPTESITTCNVRFQELQIGIDDQFSQDNLYQQTLLAEEVLSHITLKKSAYPSADSANEGDEVQELPPEITPEILSAAKELLISRFNTSIVEIEVDQVPVTEIRYELKVSEFPFSYTARNKAQESYINVTVGTSVPTNSFAFFHIPDVEYEEESVVSDTNGITQTKYTIQTLEVDTIYFNLFQLHAFNEVLRNIVSMDDESKQTHIQSAMDNYEKKLEAYNREYEEE